MYPSPTPVLLSNCGWLSVHQLAVHHTVVMVHKIFNTGQPKYLIDMFSLDNRVTTTLADQKLLKPSDTETPDHELVTDSFRCRAMYNLNLLPLKIRNESSAFKFKSQ